MRQVSPQVPLTAPSRVPAHARHAAPARRAGDRPDDAARAARGGGADRRNARVALRSAHRCAREGPTRHVLRPQHLPHNRRVGADPRWCDSEGESQRCYLDRAARAHGVRMACAWRITCETCPHYLVFSSDEIADGAREFKCAPPIRDAATREALWRALLEGQVDLLVSDHSPCPPAMKDLTHGDFVRAWGGLASPPATMPISSSGAPRRRSP